MSGQNGKGDTPRRVKGPVYRENYDAIFSNRARCEVCGEEVSVDDLVKGRACKRGGQTYHVDCLEGA